MSFNHRLNTRKLVIVEGNSHARLNVAPLGASAGGIITSLDESQAAAAEPPLSINTSVLPLADEVVAAVDAAVDAGSTLAVGAPGGQTVEEANVAGEGGAVQTLSAVRAAVEGDRSVDANLEAGRAAERHAGVETDGEVKTEELPDVEGDSEVEEVEAAAVVLALAANVTRARLGGRSDGSSGMNGSGSDGGDGVGASGGGHGGCASGDSDGDSSNSGGNPGVVSLGAGDSRSSAGALLSLGGGRGRESDGGGLGDTDARAGGLVVNIVTADGSVGWEGIVAILLPPAVAAVTTAITATASAAATITSAATATAITTASTATSVATASTATAITSASTATAVATAAIATGSGGGCHGDGLVGGGDRGSNGLGGGSTHADSVSLEDVDGSSSSHITRLSDGSGGVAGGSDGERQS